MRELKLRRTTLHERMLALQAKARTVLAEHKQSNDHKARAPRRARAPPLSAGSPLSLALRWQGRQQRAEPGVVACAALTCPLWPVCQHCPASRLAGSGQNVIGPGPLHSGGICFKL